MEKITIRKYKTLLDVSEYDNVLTHLNHSNDFNGVSFNEDTITYKDRQKVLKLIKNGNDWDAIYNIFNIMYGCTESEFDYTDIVTFYKCRNYIIHYVKTTQQRESKLLESISADVEIWRSAGGDRLNKFSAIMPLVQLGELFSIYPYDLEDKPYSEILILLVLLKERNEVNVEFSNLKRKMK